MKDKRAAARGVMARKFTGRAGSDWICQAGHPRANGGILESPGGMVEVVDRVVGGMGRGSSSVLNTTPPTG